MVVRGERPGFFFLDTGPTARTRGERGVDKDERVWGHEPRGVWAGGGAGGEGARAMINHRLCAGFNDSPKRGWATGPGPWLLCPAFGVGEFPRGHIGGRTLHGLAKPPPRPPPGGRNGIGGNGPGITQTGTEGLNFFGWGSARVGKLRGNNGRKGARGRDVKTREFRRAGGGGEPRIEDTNRFLVSFFFPALSERCSPARGFGWEGKRWADSFVGARGRRGRLGILLGHLRQAPGFVERGPPGPGNPPTMGC